MKLTTWKVWTHCYCSLFKHTSQTVINLLYFIHYALAKLWYVLIYSSSWRNCLDVDGLKGLKASVDVYLYYKHLIYSLFHLSQELSEKYNAISIQKLPHFLLTSMIITNSQLCAFWFSQISREDTDMNCGGNVSSRPIVEVCTTLLEFISTFIYFLDKGLIHTLRNPKLAVLDNSICVWEFVAYFLLHEFENARGVFVLCAVSSVLNREDPWWCSFSFFFLCFTSSFHITNKVTWNM